MDGAYFVKWREALPRARVNDKTLRAIIAAKTKNPETLNRTLAKRYKVSETTVSNFTVHLKRGEPKTLDELRLYVATRYLKEACASCSKAIKQANEGLCRRCHAKKSLSLQNGSLGKQVKIESCNRSPNQYHYWILDVYSRGECKYCNKKQQYYPWEDTYIAPIQLDF